MPTTAENRGNGGDAARVSWSELSQILLAAYNRERLVNLIEYATEKDQEMIGYIVDNINDDLEARGRSLFIGNLPKRTTEHELAAAFRAYGEIQRTRVRRKFRKSRHCSFRLFRSFRRLYRYGYVVFEDARSAVEALRTTTHYVKGRRVHVQPRIFKESA